MEGKQNSLFLERPVIKCFVMPPDSKIEKTRKKNDLLDAIAYTGCAHKIEGCQNQPVLSNNHDNSQLTKNIDSIKVALASSNALIKHSEFDLIRNSIFCCKLHTTFLPGNRDLRAS